MPVSAGQFELERAYEGQFVTTTSNRTIVGTADNLVNASATEDYLPFGRFIVDKPGGEYGEVDLPSAAGQTIIGVVGFTDSFERKSDNPVETGIPYRQMVTVGKACRIALKAETAMNYGDTVFVRHTDEAVPGSLEGRGRARNDNSGGNADALPAGQFKVVSEAAAGEIFEVELDIPTTV